LLSSPTPFQILPFGAVERKALGKDLRKKVLTEHRFPIASAKGKTSTAMRTGPLEARKPRWIQTLRGKGPDRQPNLQGSTQEPWRNSLGNYLRANGWDLGSTPPWA
jgi:hypothetical protein